MRNSGDVKDKHIMLENFKFRARVCYYNGNILDCGLFETLVKAQKELRKYPRDVWDGYETTNFKYREPDEYTKRKVRDRVEAPRPLIGSERVFGRTFGRDGA